MRLEIKRTSFQSALWHKLCDPDLTGEYPVYGLQVDMEVETAYPSLGNLTTMTFIWQTIR